MLEVIVLNLADAQIATHCGVGRLELVGTMAAGGLSPAPRAVEEIVVSGAAPVRPMLRLEAGFAAQNIPQLQSLARDYINAGADGLVLGFLKNRVLDTDTTNEVLAAVPAGTPFTFHRAIDESADYLAAWRDLSALAWEPDQVLTSAGQSRAGKGVGVYREVLRLFPAAQQQILAGGGLRLEDVPALRALGISGFHTGSAVRKGKSFTQTIDKNLLLAWVGSLRGRKNDFS